METIKKDTIIRTIVLVVALVNNCLTMAGYNPLPFENEEIADGLSMVFTAAAALWAWWKNNSFTKNALAADEYLNQLKQCNN